jgi:hypothetical protein
VDDGRLYEQQVQRALAAGCERAPAFWAADGRAQFGWCLDASAGEVLSKRQQRESVLQNCELLKTNAYVVGRDFRVSGGPGDYTIEWTLESKGCQTGRSSVHCFAQVRVTEPGKPALQSMVRNPDGHAPFKAPLTEKYRGGAGDVVEVAFQSCLKSALGSSSCTPWSVQQLVMPAAEPNFEPARVVGVTPASYTPLRLRERADDGHLLRVESARDAVRFDIALAGSSAAFHPTPFQLAAGWTPEVVVRVRHGRKILFRSSSLLVPEQKSVGISVPTRALNAVQCRPSPKLTGLCEELDVEVESIRRWLSGPAKDWREHMGTSRARLVLTSDRLVATEKAKLQAPAATTPARRQAATAQGRVAMLGPGSVEFGMNRPGGDFRSLAADAAQACRAACAADAGCRAWTWVKPGVQAAEARCWLKSVVPPARPDACCTSGVR